MLARTLKRLVESVVANPWVYDAVQNLLGHRRTCRILAPRLTAALNCSVLDVGAGTGNLARLLPPATYYWLDNDVDKLRGFRSKFRGRYCAVLGDAVRLCFRDGSVDYVACIAVAHHLDDTALPILLGEIARVCRGRLVFLDPVWCPGSLIGRLLWWLDRGANPRTAEQLEFLLSRHFELVEVLHYSIWHHYLLYIARPRLTGGPDVSIEATGKTVS